MNQVLADQPKQLTLRLKQKPVRLIGLMGSKDDYIIFPRVKELIESAMFKIDERKMEDLTVNERCAIKTLLSFRHKELDHFADNRPGRTSIDHQTYLSLLNQQGAGSGKV